MPYYKLHDLIGRLIYYSYFHSNITCKLKIEFRVLNATKGKIGGGRIFFQAAFGQDVDEFFDILWMPEAFIIQRYDHRDDGSTQEWRDKFNALAPEQLDRAKAIISENNFSDAIVDACDDPAIRDVLYYYQIRNPR